MPLRPVSAGRKGRAARKNTHTNGGTTVVFNILFFSFATRGDRVVGDTERALSPGSFFRSLSLRTVAVAAVFLLFRARPFRGRRRHGLARRPDHETEARRTRPTVAVAVVVAVFVAVFVPAIATAVIAATPVAVFVVVVVAITIVTAVVVVAVVVVASPATVDPKTPLAFASVPDVRTTNARPLVHRDRGRHDVQRADRRGRCLGRRVRVRTGRSRMTVAGSGPNGRRSFFSDKSNIGNTTDFQFFIQFIRLRSFIVRHRC